MRTEPLDDGFALSFRDDSVADELEDGAERLREQAEKLEEQAAKIRGDKQ
ncbi:hypothetical protein N0B31_18670 [Salinirubellus salinus]|uniref:Uncharacterized protein n=1 Tax=Salinirubellus salinus TaxID=1364945 RepID=A0A9E7R250_9EURY|nr:hypothetical protein [Salinirubellus salinus]UWM54127.1 hypothetical protein N0B31_18670 [Salinirubellus salinus]